MTAAMQSLGQAPNAVVHSRAQPQNDHQQGYSAATLVMQAITETHSSCQRITLVADAIGELIDLDLGWERMAPTLARLQGFAAGLMPVLSEALGVPTRPQEGASKTPCALLQAPGGSL